ncbi:riboflavin biosynthesis protein RibF [Dysgonomonas sp. 25]|uniref:riboflavin biosynthesis protein RibF n=1 Tax=Dysgonomonas sp. 25 TaxID=2302933 RepID=UPI0013D7C808|nr:riboflavin biosynthesis protein RibF [Dysgonomonas sp. 25]NDV68016.1 riboflavin biosynthesis protein RibF [Dysgonomonas sp. 25]
MILLQQQDESNRKPIVASIGFFDGVHAGHRYLISQIKEIAGEKGLASAVITFPVHPRKVLQADYQPALLCGYEERIERLASTGVDYCIPLDFTIEMSRLSARDFIHQVLKQMYNVDTLVIGYDHRFGYNREDGFEEYVQYGKEVGMNVVQAKQYPDEYVSSSFIRTLLKEGNIEKAAKLLTYNYTICGKIIKGFQVGRTIGFPTANVESWERYKVIPAFGVYAVHVYTIGQKLDGMLYIGTRPTVDNGQNISVEVNIFDFDGDLYNKDLTVEFLEFVRPDIKFGGLDELRAQLFRDKEEVRKRLDAYH